MSIKVSPGPGKMEIRCQYIGGPKDGATGWVQATGPVCEQTPVKATDVDGDPVFATYVRVGTT